MANFTIIFLLAVAIIVAISSPDVEMKRAKATFACTKHGGLYSLEGSEGAMCKNGSMISNETIDATIISDPAYFPTHKE